VASTIVQVYAVELDRRDDEVESLRSVLTPDERDGPVRAQVARAAARVVLGDTIRMDPAAVPISRRCEHCGHTSHGRPVVAAAVPVSFNVSHSGPLGLIAVLEGDARIGVDLEVVRRRPRLDALAERVLDADAHAAWLRLPDQDARLRAFLEAWTEKEAYLKARGVGITTSLRAVSPAPDGWTVQAFSPRAGFVAALAADRAGVRIEQRELVLDVMPSAGTAG
jgi:4'-phosphopantetheinyl transferase